MQNQNVRLIVAFAIGFIVGLGVYAVWSSSGDTSDVANTPNDGEVNGIATTTDDVVKSGNSVSVENQVAGKKVTLTEVTLENPGWVAIHDDVNGQPGRILGAKLFDKGTSKGDVTLLRATANGTNYLAVIHTDDGNYKEFNPRTDTALLASDGKPVMVSFSVESLSADIGQTIEIDLSK